MGTARADFPGGDAQALCRTSRRLWNAWGKRTSSARLPPAGRPPAWETTVAEQRAKNIHVRDGVGEDEFVRMRMARDATLGVPTLILPSLQVNIRGGRLPPPEDNGVAYLRIPLNALH